MTCSDGISIDASSDAANECGGTLDIEQTEADYNTERGDGSVGQMENIGMDQPSDGAFYSGAVIDSSETGGTVPFMLIFSGLDASGLPIIFDYFTATIDPSLGPEYPYSFTYEDPAGSTVDTIEVSFPEITADSIYAILMGGGAEPHALTITLLWNAEEDLDVTFTCNDGVTIDWYNQGGENSCGARLDVEQTISDYDTERGDGSLGQIENISLDYPSYGTEYGGQIIHYSGGSPVDFMVVYSGLDDEGTLVIYDYLIETLDPETSREYWWSFLYEGPFQYTFEQVAQEQVYFPEVTGDVVDEILKQEGTYVDAFTITLLWNADDDLDLAFDCHDGKTIDWGNKEGTNSCRARYDVEQGKPNYNVARGDGSFGQVENIRIPVPTPGHPYTGRVIHWTKQYSVEFMVILSGLDEDGNTVIYDYFQGILNP